MQSLADFLGARNLPEDTPNPDPPAPKVSIKDRARQILESREYFQSVLDRIKLGTLPPAVELRFYDEAYGKVVTRLEVKNVSTRLREMSVEQLEDRAQRLLARARELRETQESTVH